MDSNTLIKISETASSIRWTISNPNRLNALGTHIGVRLMELLDELQTSIKSKAKTIHSLFICAETTTKKTGPIWVAGGDLQELKSFDKSQGEKYSELYIDILQKLKTLPFPVITVVDGAAIGGGAEFALASDLRIGTEDTSFQFKQHLIGLTCGFGGSYLLKEITGEGIAKDLIMMSRSIDANEALSLGIITEIVDSRDMDTRLNEIEDHFAKIPTDVLQAQKLLLAPDSSSLKEHCQLQIKLFKEVWHNPVHKKFLDQFKLVPLIVLASKLVTLI